MDNSRPRQSDHLGVNKIGKNIRKSPLHQPNSVNGNAARPEPQPQPQPHVYNISKNDFRSVVQQLTGSPSRESLPRPPQNPPKPQNTRLHKIRPAPLTQINQPPAPAPVLVPPPAMALLPPAPYNTNLARPLPPSPYGQLSPLAIQPMVGPGNVVLSNTAESPVSAYMRYLQSSLMDSGSNGNQAQYADQSQPCVPGQGQPQPQMPGHAQPQPPPSGSVPGPAAPAPPMPPSLPSPRLSGPAPAMPNLPSPQFNGPAPFMPGLPFPWFNAPHPPMPSFLSPQMNIPGLLPSPTSQFVLPSPTAYPYPFSPRSPYPLLSPGVQYPPPQTPNFTFSPMGQPGILGPGPQPPPSPGMMFPLSSPGFFPIASPRWRDH